MSFVGALGRWGEVFRMRLRPELREFYWFQTLFAFAFALIVIFEPVFFYKEGFSLARIALYYAFHYSLYVVVLPWGGMFASRFGLERSLAVSLPIFVGYFVALALVPSWPWLMWVAAAVLAAHKIFYWPAFYAELARFGEDGNRGTEMSWLRVLRYGVGILGPLVGGVIAQFSGFPMLFMMTAVVVLVSAWPLLKTKERYRPVRVSYGKAWQMMLSRRLRRVSLTMLGSGENLIDMVYWPVFVFIVVGSTSELGVLASIGVAVMTLVTFFVGEWSDRLPQRYVLRLHLPFLMLSYLFRPLAGTPLMALTTDTLARMSFAGVNLPMWYRITVVGKRNGPVMTITAVEMALAIAKAVTALVLAGLFAVTLPYTGFVVTFVLAALLGLFYLFL